MAPRAVACSFDPDLLIRTSSAVTVDAVDRDGCGYRTVAWWDGNDPAALLENGFVTDASWLRGGRSFVYGWTHGNAFVADRTELRRGDTRGGASKLVLRVPLAGMITEVAASPDGRRIAFSLFTPNYPVIVATWTGIGSTQRIYVVNADGSGLQPVSSVTTAFDSGPSWSPDGRRLAFASDRGQTSVYVSDLSVPGALATRVTPLDVSALAPRWSPDGRLIAFQTGLLDVRSPIAPRLDTWTVRPDGAAPRRVLADATMASWAPDSRHLVVSRRYGLAVLDLRTRRARALTDVYEAQDVLPAWSKDGRTIAFVRLGRYGAKLVTVRPDGRSLRVVASDEYGLPVWRR